MLWARSTALAVGFAIAAQWASAVTIADAGPNLWTTHGPDGGGVHAIAIDPLNPATLYVGAFHGGVFKSTDAGASWAAANAGLPDDEMLSLAIDSLTPATLYAGTSDGVLSTPEVRLL